MDSPDKDWWIVHTCEYVLGLLDDQDTVVLEKVMQHEPDIAKMVADWSDWFQPMSDALTPIEPPATILPLIIKNLPLQPRRSGDDTGDAESVENNPNHINDSAAVMQLLRKNQQLTDGWRAFAGLAVCTCLAMVLYFGWAAS